MNGGIVATTKEKSTRHGNAGGGEAGAWRRGLVDDNFLVGTDIPQPRSLVVAAGNKIFSSGMEGLMK